MEDQDQDAFAAGFEDKHEPTVTPAPQDQEAVQETTPEEVVQEAVRYAQLTEAELQDIKARAAMIDQIKATQDKSFGTFGRTIKEMQDRVSALTAAPTADIEQADIDALRNDGFEAHARALEKLRDLKVLHVGKEAAPISEDAIAAVFEKRFQEARVAEVAEEHPDWQEVVAKPEFAAWKATQSAADQARLNNSWNPAFISRKLSEFKDAQAVRPDPRKSRFAAAVTPTTRAASSASATEDPFLAGFRDG